MALESLGYFGMFLMAFLAATLIPMSSDAVFLGMLVGGYKALPLTIAASAGNTLGGLTSYYLGYLGKWKWLEKYGGVKREKVEKWRNSISKFGGLMALLTWLPFIGDVMAVGLGFFRIRFTTVLIFMTIGKTLRYVTIAYLWPLAKEFYDTGLVN